MDTSDYLWLQKQNMQTIFTETPGEEIFPTGKCLEIFYGPFVQS